MKNKKITYLLIVGVALVWGIIFYRIFIGLAEEDVAISFASPTKFEYFNLTDHAMDKVTLNLNYRNPFQKESLEAIASEEIKPPTTKISAVSTPLSQRINWPEVLFKGYIYNATTKQKIAILQINGQELMLAEGQSTNGIKLLKNAKDSVQLQYQNHSKYIKIR